MSNTALLVIDVQHSFFHRDYWVEDDFPAYVEKQARLIELGRQHGWKIVYILHNETQGAFSPESGYVQSMDFINRLDDEPVFNKHVHTIPSPTSVNT